MRRVLISSGLNRLLPTSVRLLFNKPQRPSSRLSSLRFFLFFSLLFTPAVHAQCPTGPISYIFIDNHSIFDTSDPGLNSKFGWAYRAANSLHVRTKRIVIERELLFEPGDCYDPFLLQETERLLRAYDFLAQVDVFGIPQPDGSYHVVIDTRDQWSTSLDLRIGFDRGFSLDGIRLRETNLLGRGQEIAVFYRHREVTRDYGVTLGTRQFAGTRWDLRTALGKTRAGTFVDQTVSYPFIGEVGRYAARQSFTREDQFFDYIFDTPEQPSQHILLPVREKTFDVGIGSRLGHRGNLTVVGAMLTYHELTFPGDPELAEERDFDERVPLDSTMQQQLLTQREPLGSVRLGVVFGQRNVWWVKKRGFDTMRGHQDIPLGADVTIAIARSLKALERNNDMMATFKFYAGISAGPALFTTRARFDARRDFESGVNAREWEDVYGELETLNYWRPTPNGRHTFLLRGALAGAWNTTTPFQLTLGGDRNLRGYHYDRFPGGRRAVFNLEDRIYIGWPLPDVMDLGATIFADLGRIWPGDVPFGQASGWRKTIGAGLRGSFPPGSRTSFRLDFATALDGGFRWKNVRMVLSASEILGLTSFDSPDTQLLRSRNEGLAGELFRFTNR